RAVAFPGVPDNRDEYFKKFFRQANGERDLALRACEKRDQLSGWFDRMIEKYALDRCDLVGFTAMFRQTLADIAMARKLKALAPGLVTVVGGACCEGAMGRELSKRAEVFDYVFSGPALVSFPQLVQELLDGAPGRPRIRGVFSRGDTRLEVSDGCGPE